VQTGNRGDDLLNSICSGLRRRDQLVAVPWNQQSLLVLGSDVLQVRPSTGANWSAEFADGGAHALDIDDAMDLEVVARLVHVLFTSLFENLPHYWRESRSARIWYPDKPRESRDGIGLFQRISFSTQAIADIGVGVAIDVRHRFLTLQSLAYYFDASVPVEEQRLRRHLFDELRQRSERRKGTLVYDVGRRTRYTCYFVSPEHGKTCATVGPLQFDGKYFPSLYDYYRREKPKAGVEPGDAVVSVSFRGLNGAKPVAAKLLRLSVGLEEERIPHTLRRLLPIPPHIREQLIRGIWDGLPLDRLTRADGALSAELWTPDPQRQMRLEAPNLVFAGQTLRAPRAATLDEYKSYYRSRRQILADAGFLAMEDVASRDIKLVVPNDTATWPAELTQQFAKDLLASIQRLARRDFTTTIIRADTCEAIVERLGKDPSGFAVIVFDARERAAYALLSHELRNWRKKRFTVQVVRDSWRALRNAEPGTERQKAQKHWDDMLFHSAIDVLDQMGGTPWRLATAPYEACLAIDVSDDRRHYGLTLIICRSEDQYPSFQRVTRVWCKGDHQFETINSEVLTDSLSKLMENLRSTLGGFDALRSLMVIRDGQECGNEIEGIGSGLERWREMGCLADDAIVDIAALLKTSTKDMRVWRRRENDRNNVLEGQAVLLDRRTTLVCCTGAATLGGHGTVEPIVLKGIDDATNMSRLANGVFAFAQLNYSSPGRAYREPLSVKELDAALAERVAQDTRGIK
jgi:hypothetical protein